MRSFLIKVLIAALPILASAEENTTWISPNYPADIFSKGTIDKANDVAKCAATFEVVSELFLKWGKPQTATSIHNLGNGAKTTILAIFLLDFALDEENKNISDEAYKNKYKKYSEYAVMQSNDLPKKNLTLIMSELELTDNKQKWMDNQLISLKRCSSKEALSFQQTSIDAIRQFSFGVKN